MEQFNSREPCLSALKLKLFATAVETQLSCRNHLQHHGLIAREILSLMRWVPIHAHTLKWQELNTQLVINSHTCAAQGAAVSVTCCSVCVTYFPLASTQSFSDLCTQTWGLPSLSSLSCRYTCSLLHLWIYPQSACSSTHQYSTNSNFCQLFVKIPRFSCTEKSILQEWSFIVCFVASHQNHNDGSSPSLGRDVHCNSWPEVNAQNRGQ